MAGSPPLLPVTAEGLDEVYKGNQTVFNSQATLLSGAMAVALA